MAKRGRPTTKAQKLKPVSPAQAVPPDPQTKHAEDAHLNDTTSDQTFQGARYPTQKSTKITAPVNRRSTRFKSSSEPVKNVQPATVELDTVETVNRVELPSNMENHPPEEANNVAPTQKPLSAQATLPNAENAYLNDTTSDETFQGARYPAQRDTTNTATLYGSTQVKSPPEPVENVQPAVVELDPVETVNRVELQSNMENHPLEETNNVPGEHSNKEKSPEVAGVNYRKMYIVSHKKVKTLTKQNRVLRKQLEKALGKIEVYAELTPTLYSLSKANQTLIHAHGLRRRD